MHLILIKKSFLLRCYEDCAEYVDNVDDNDDTYIEQRKFEQSQAFQSVIENVKEKTGVTLELDELDAVWDICR